MSSNAESTNASDASTKNQQETNGEMECFQEDGFMFEESESSSGPYMTLEQKKQRLQHLKDQADNGDYCKKSLSEVYPNVKVITAESDK